MDSLYKILEQISYSFKVHLVFHAKKLCKDLRNPFFG